MHDSWPIDKLNIRQDTCLSVAGKPAMNMCTGELDLETRLPAIENLFTVSFHELRQRMAELNCYKTNLIGTEQI